MSILPFAVFIIIIIIIIVELFTSPPPRRYGVVEFPPLLVYNDFFCFHYPLLSPASSVLFQPSFALYANGNVTALDIYFNANKRAGAAGKCSGGS
uniref:Uncharacterized protein n=1 Tax=Anguilla anguilla TaxID=7936 RepID=A0A0E9XKK3_ANGAN